MLARRVAAPLLGAVLAAALYPGTWNLDGLAREGQLGPGFLPRVALIGLGLACVAKVVEEWRRARLLGERAPGASDPRPPLARAKLAASIAAVVGYVLLTPLAGFPLVTALFIAAFLLLCGMRSPRAIVANTVIGVLALLYLFVKVVYLPLPKGDGPFEAITLALYRALRLF